MASAAITPTSAPVGMVDDILAYVDSIGEPTGLVGWSGGANLALAVAAQSDAVDAVAPFEPVILSLMDEQEQAALGDAVARMGELAAEGRLTAAVRAFAGFPSTTRRSPWPRTPATSRPQGATSRTCSTSFQQWMEYEGPTADDPAVLGAISAPVLVLHGSDTKPFFTASARHVADHVPNARMHEIPGAGHAAP